jgi:hypothetical protein
MATPLLHVLIAIAGFAILQVVAICDCVGGGVGLVDDQFLRRGKRGLRLFLGAASFAVFAKGAGFSASRPY